MDKNAVDPARYAYTPGKTEVSDIDLDRQVVTMDSKRCTEADAARDVARFERRLRGLSRGGHSLSDNGARSPQVTVTLPTEVRDEVRARASAEGMSMPKWLRRLIERSIAA